MRDHPIPPVTEQYQYRAIGVVRGIYKSLEKEKFTRGKLIDSYDEEIDCVVLGKMISLMQRHISLEDPHLWVVYPRSREQSKLHLQISGIWEPSTLSQQSDPDRAKHEKEEELPEGDDFFSIRGDLIFTKPQNNELIVKVKQKRRLNGFKPSPFKLNLEGEIPIEALHNFLDLKVRRKGQKLIVETFDLLGKKIKNNTKKGK
tara:strand:+ start:154 stop:759 length:606 start_codon:yes stop_codon:yes gene_type:complete